MDAEVDREKFEAMLKPFTDEAFSKGFEFGHSNGVRTVYFEMLRWACSDDAPSLREERFALTEFARKFIAERWPKDIDP